MRFDVLDSMLQVHRPFAGTPGCVVVRESPLLVLAGDAFVQMSHFDGCVDSAISVSNVVNARKDAS